MDWDLWIGTAPMRPYNSKYAPFNWRGWWDFGCGALGDMACHIMDPAFWALKLEDADSFSVECVRQEGANDQTAPDSSVIKYEFPARGEMPPVVVYWYDGAEMPPRPEGVPEDQKLGDGNNGSYFIGDEGILTAGEYGGEARLLPDEKMHDSTMPPETIERVPGNSPYLDWIRACKGGPKACSNFDYSGPFTEMVNFGNIALRTGEKVTYNSKAGTLDKEKHAHLLTKEYREGWELPA